MTSVSKKHKKFRWIAIALWLAAVQVYAIQPAKWVHTTEADFEPGKTTNIVVTNLGDIKLAHHTEQLSKVLEEASIIYDVAALDDGTLYLAAGPEAKLLKRKGDKVETVLELKNEQVFCLDRTAEGKLLVAVSGPNARIAVLEGSELKDLVVLKDVKYIWDTVVDGQVIYVATGIEGKLFRIDLAAKNNSGDSEDSKETGESGDSKDSEVAEESGESEVSGAGGGDGGPEVKELFDAAQTNLLCLGRDSKGRLFAGSDTDGLVYRLTLNDKGEAETFVVYDASEPEIGALVIMEDGTIYIGTADAAQARPGRMGKPVKEEKGRPEKGSTEKPARPKSPDTEPKPQPVKPGDKVQPQTTPDTPDTAKTPAPTAEDAKSAEMPEEQDPPQPAETTAKEKATDTKPKPTAEQHNQLRDEMRKRLLATRDGGNLQAGPSRTSRPVVTSSRSRSSRSGKPKVSKKGNAVYRITADGFVNEVFRESVMILKMLSHDGKLIIATGNEGQIYSVDVAADETSMLVDLVPEQIPAMFKGPDDHILLGTANPAQLLRLDPGFAAEGTFTSDVLDASQISRWGAMSITADVPESSKLQILTRSGNVDDPEKAAWSKWSEPITLEHDAKRLALSPRYTKLTSDPARFLQYQLKLESINGTSPVVDRIAITYVVPNLKPQIKAIKTSYVTRKPAKGAAGATPPGTKLKLEWTATDPNKDPMLFTLEYQFAGTDAWLPLAEDLKQNRHEWQTLYVPDGRYTVRVTATDAPGNPPNMTKTAHRSSDPILVDNSSPQVQIAQPKATGSSISIALKVQDALSTIRAVAFQIDGEDNWQVVLPDDLIYDSTTEAVTIIIPDLESGRHAVSIRAMDSRGNAVYKAMFVNITKGKP